MFKINRFFRKIWNLIRWFPIIWKDEDFDDYFIFQILKFKLKNQSEYIGYHDRHLSAKRDAEKMMLCVKLIERVQDEWYGVEYMSYHNPQFNWIDSVSHPDSYELDIVDDPNDNFDEYFKKYPLIYKKVINDPKPIFGNDSRFRIAMNIAHINEERAHKLLFNILQSDIRKWWD